MNPDVSKSEKERLLDEKIRALKERNARMEERKKVVDKDRLIAEQSKSSVTIVAKPKSSGEDRIGPAASSPPRKRDTRKGRRDSDEVGAGNRSEHPKNRHAPQRNSDPNGPPPDPAYRYLADRMYETSDEDDYAEDDAAADHQHGNQSGGRGKQTNGRNRGGHGSAGRGKGIKARLGKPVGGRAVQNAGRESRKADNRTDLEENDGYYDDDWHEDHQHHVGGKKNTVSNARHFNGRKSGDQRDLSHYAQKVRTLLDEEPSSVKKGELKNAHADGYGSDEGKRIIKDLGGRLTITKTLEKRPEPLLSPDSVAPTKEYDNGQAIGFSEKNGLQTVGRHVTKEKPGFWRCPDPSCNENNAAGTFECIKCRLPYETAANYINNLACKKTRQDYFQKVSKNRLNGYVGNEGEFPVAHEQQPIPPFREKAEEVWPLEAPQQHFDQEWLAAAQGNQQFIPQEIMVPDLAGTPQAPYGIVMNPVAVPNYPPPFFPVTTSAQFFGQPPTTAVAEFIPVTFQSPTVSPAVAFAHQPPVMAPFAQSPPAPFNLSAQVFVPKVEQQVAPNLYQHPPPSVAPPNHGSRSHMGGRAGKPKHGMNTDGPHKHDSSMLLPLKTPPNPLPFKRQGSEGRWHHDKNGDGGDPSTRNGHFGGGKPGMRLGRFPQHGQREQRGGKQLSMLEMQSGAFKKGSLPPPPSTDKGNGLLVFGTSNVVNHLQTDHLEKMLRIPVSLIPAMKLDAFETKVKEVDASRDWLVLIHGLGNDARNIALHRNTDQEKVKEADNVANKFCDLIERNILALSPHIRVLVSMLLPRCDFQERVGMTNPNTVRKVINVQITQRLYENPRVTLINSDQILDWTKDESRLADLMQSDGYHLTQLGFDLLFDNWLRHLSVHVEKVRGDSANDDDSVVPMNDDALAAEASSQPHSDTDNTVPDPFDSYTAPTIIAPPVAKIRRDESSPSFGSDCELDDDAVPNLETVHKEAPTPATNDRKTPSETTVNATEISLPESPVPPHEDAPNGNDATTTDQSDSEKKVATSANSSAAVQEAEQALQKCQIMEADKPEPVNSTVGDEEEDEEDMDGFIDDSYCGEMDHNKNVTLPSLFIPQNCGPESEMGLVSGVGPISGFMEDSYLPVNEDLANRKTITFSWANKAQRNVKIGGSFNDWSPTDMERDAEGEWTYSVDLRCGQYQYKYYIDNTWCLDPEKEIVEVDGVQNNVVRVQLD